VGGVAGWPVALAAVRDLMTGWIGISLCLLGVVASLRVAMICLTELGRG
jgi:hypothetical protein